MRVQDLQQFLSKFTEGNKDGSRQGNALSNAVLMVEVNGYLEKNSNYSESKSTNLICIYIDALRIKSFKVQKTPLLCIGLAC